MVQTEIELKIIERWKPYSNIDLDEYEDYDDEEPKQFS